MKDNFDFSKTVYLVVFCILFVSFKDMYFLVGINETLLSGILGGLGALIGTVIYQLVINKNNYIKWGVLAVCIVLLILLSFSLSINRIKSQFEKEYSVYIDSILALETKRTLSMPIDLEALKPPKLTDAEYKRLITCEVCGYKAVCPESTYCYNCISQIFDTSIFKLEQKKSWLEDQQLFWFYPDSLTGKVHFFDPKIENGFQKDSLWKPVVTEVEVRKYNFNDN